MKFSVKKIDTLLKTIFSVDQYRVRKEYDDGTLFGEFKRINIDRGEAVAMVLYDPQRTKVILVRQFRLAKYTKTGDGMLWEIPAGMMEKGESPEEVAIRETLEETGYDIDKPRRLKKIILAPGVMNEYIHLFYAEINPGQKVAPGGGLAAEGEHLEVHEINLNDALAMVENGEIDDAKTIIGLFELKKLLAI